ncbi:hypothetical protein HN51_023271, partial [Arachis hypogaea]
TNLYHDMYKGLDEFNMSLQRYNSLLKSDLEAANEAQRKLEIEIASNFGGGPHVAMTHPTALTNCNIDMESLISDQNRSIATLAITTLLKTGNELRKIPKQLGNIIILLLLSHTSNNFSGVVPSELGKLINLQTLVLSLNQLTENLPSAL